MNWKGAVGIALAVAIGLSSIVWALCWRSVEISRLRAEIGYVNEFRGSIERWGTPEG